MSFDQTELFAGRYRMEASLGSGAQGLAVRVADTLRQDTSAVLKVGLSGQESLDGTIREFEALRSLTTPYIAPVIDLGFAGPQDLDAVHRLFSAGRKKIAASSQVGARPYLVRHWVDGETLIDWASRSSVERPDDHQQRLLAILAHTAEALAELHRSGLVHGDIKPEHVLVVEDGDEPLPVLIDFGLAVRDRRGTLGGTPGYLAPERLRGVAASAESDRWALGVVMIQAILGYRAPVASAQTVEDLPDIVRKELSERGAHSLRRLLDPNPDKRPRLDSIRTALLPPDRAIEGFSAVATEQQLPFLGRQRRDLLGQLVADATSQRVSPVVMITGEHGAGRSRALRQLQWGLQGDGHPAFEIVRTSSPMASLLQLGPRLASLHGKTFSPPDAASFVGDRAHWIQEVAASLVEVVPPQGASVLWDDIADDARDGLDAVEALALVVERTAGRLRLWLSTLPEQLPQLRGLFASSGFTIARLPPLTREDIDGLVGLVYRGRPVSNAELGRLYEESAGLPARLASLLAHEEREAPVDRGRLTWLQALVGVVPGGVTHPELEIAADVAGVSSSELADWLASASAAGQVFVGPPRHGSQHRTYQSRPGSLRALADSQREHLASAVEALQAHGVDLDTTTVDLLVTVLRGKSEAILDVWVASELEAPGVAQGRLLTFAELALEASLERRILRSYLRVAMEAGRLERANEFLRELLDRVDGPTEHGMVQTALAKIAYAGGRLPAVDEILEDLPDELAEEDRAALALVRAQAEMRRGKYAEAKKRALSAAEDLGEEHNEVRAELWVTGAASAAFQGDESDQGFADAKKTLDQLEAPAQVRSRYEALRAIAAYMHGQLDEATEGYRRALEIVEEAGLDADRPLYLLNLGTAFERQVRLSMARQYYELGVRCCLPTTRPSTRALLLANRANLDIRLGRTGEARELLAAAARIAAEAQLAAITRFTKQLEAEADAAEGELKRACEVMEACANEYGEAGDRRHACELYVRAGLNAVRSGDAARARRLLARAEADVDDFPDLKPRASILHAEIACSRGGIDYLAGVDRYLRALERALEAGDDLTVLENARWLRRSMHERADQADPLATDELDNIVRRAWRRVALSLTPELRADLARHLELPQTGPSAVPRQSALSPQPNRGHVATLSRPTVPSVARATGSVMHPAMESAAIVLPDLTPKFYRMLSLNRRILGETERTRLIPVALDIALELSGAERGFVLLAGHDESEFSVAFSRDVDGRPISEDELQISMTVAREVAETGRPVVTVDAAADDRFGQAKSIHVLQLTSILCVPIVDRQDVLGCLYLDHRNQPGVFDGEVPRMLAAYADQVAIALQTCARTEELKHERDELARAREQIESLLAEKDELLSDLATRCETLEAEIARERSASALRYNYDNMVAESPAMRRVLGQIDRVVDTVLPIVVQGESGTGKELIARAIHFNGARRNRAFVPVNCGALNEEILESELFGHKRGAFTGATSDRKGLFETASGGTLFLDEVGEMSLAMQVKLLRALQEQRIRPVGSSIEIPVDVRIVAATNRDLAAMVDKGTFRQDLYYRLATLVVQLPPLRDRKTDIPLLVRELLSRECERIDRDVPTVDGSAVSLLVGYGWPGNIRQLENIVRASLVMTDGAITADVLRPLLPGAGAAESAVDDSRPRSNGRGTNHGGQAGRPVKKGRAEVATALDEAEGNRRIAAENLGVSLRTLQRYLNRYGLG